jgi:hypothetical protein
LAWRYWGNLLAVHTKGIGQIGFHGSGVGHDFGLLSDDGGVHVDDLAVVESDLARGFVQEDHAGGVFPARIGIGKVRSDVAFAESAEDGVANSVHEDVGIGMAVKPLVMGDDDAAQDQLAAWTMRT